MASVIGRVTPNSHPELNNESSACSFSKTQTSMNLVTPKPSPAWTSAIFMQVVALVLSLTARPAPGSRHSARSANGNLLGQPVAAQLFRNRGRNVVKSGVGRLDIANLRIECVDQGLVTRFIEPR